MVEDVNTYTDLIATVQQRILEGESISRSEAETLLDTRDRDLLCLLAAADRIRIEFCGYSFDTCSLINARAGACSEDCAFCAQSARYQGASDTYPLESAEKILGAASAAQKAGASRFCTVTSGGRLSERDFDSLVSAIERVHSEVDIALDASLGFLDREHAEKLHDAGVTRYNHNLETCRDYYGRICTTHMFDQRVETVRTVMTAGMSACCGGIIGLGETASQRLDLAFTLAELGVDCVPINILNPRPGTPLENASPPEPLEILKTVALFRLILPKATIKIAGGREVNLGDFQAMALRAGANGMIIGGYLTTSGRSVEQDWKMVRQAGFLQGEA